MINNFRNKRAKSCKRWKKNPLKLQNVCKTTIDLGPQKISWFGLLFLKAQNTHKKEKNAIDCILTTLWS